jgi:DNA invertase Pin-like site-specific DNA recombinase
MKQAIGYIRVSTEQQAQEGVSLDAQRAKLKTWCKANGYELVAIHEDAGISGALEIGDRPGLGAALDEAKRRKVAALVVVKRDRLARDYVEAGLIERLFAKVGAKVLATDGGANGDSPEDMLQRGIVDLFATYERMLIKLRTKTALQHKKRTGQKYTNKTPYGFEAIDGRLVQVQQEAEVVAEIQTARAGGKTLQAIADSLNERGIPTKTGRQWQPATIHYLLKRTALVAAH